MDQVFNGIDNWFDESQDYYWDDQESFATTGHWTAGVWAKSRYIGCGYANCDFDSPFGDAAPNWINFVCKMYPGGNFGSGQPYTEGTKCSDCDGDRSTCTGDNSGLCDGGMCLNCAVDYFQSDCGYDEDSCPSTMYYGDGIGSETTASPTTPPTTAEPTSQPTMQPTGITVIDGTWTDDLKFALNVDYDASDLYENGWYVMVQIVSVFMEEI